MPMIPLNDLRRQYLNLQAELDAAAQRVLVSGWYILGPEVEAFEAEFAAYSRVEHCLALGNGTDALELALRTLHIGSGSQVFTVANAGMYASTAIRLVGATPVYVDTDLHTHLIDPSSLAATLKARLGEAESGAAPANALVVTHLYGRMAPMPAILELARRYHLPVIEDCAQAHGAALAGRRAGAWGDMGAFSFYPTKNLGALGDGGALITNNPAYDERARRLRQYGWLHKYHAADTGGRNSRMDELQAAFLRAKLPHLDGWNTQRAELAARYNAELAPLAERGALILPALAEPESHVQHLYVIQLANPQQREKLRRALLAQGIGVDIHYPLPDHLQPAQADLEVKRGALPNTEASAETILTLPLFPELTGAELATITQAVRQTLAPENGPNL